MARKSRGRKRKAKRKNAKSASSKAAPSPKAPETNPPETVEADVVIAAVPDKVESPALVRPVVHQADVIEIRPAEDVDESELIDDSLSLGEWDEPEFQEVPIPPKESPSAEDDDSMEELDALQSEIDAMLEHSSLTDAPLVYQEEASAVEDEEPSLKRVHRFERKLQPADRLPEELKDSESETESNKLLAAAPKALPTPETGATWGSERAGGEGAPEKFYGGKNVLGVIEEIPLIGRVLVRDGAWRPLTLFIAIFSLINALIVWLVLSLVKDEEDLLRSVNPGVVPTSPAESVPMEEIRSAVRAFTVASTWEEKLKHVRAAGYVFEKLRDYYANKPVQLGEDVIIDRAERVEMNGLDLFKIEATILPQKDVLVLMLERDARGHLKVDWEVAVDYQEVPWQSFYSEQRRQPTNLRVVLSFQDPPYHNYQFDDPVKYRGYRLWYPDADLPKFTGYVERGSDLDKELEALLVGQNAEKHPAILTLAYPESPKDPAMVHIRDLVSPGWVVDYESSATTDQ